MKIIKLSMENNTASVDVMPDEVELAIIDDTLNSTDVDATAAKLASMQTDINIVTGVKNVVANNNIDTSSDKLSLEMAHTVLDSLFAKYNVKYSQEIISTEDYQTVNVSMEKVGQFLSGLKQGVGQLLVKLIESIKEMFSKIKKFFIAQYRKVLLFLKSKFTKLDLSKADEFVTWVNENNITIESNEYFSFTEENNGPVSIENEIEKFLEAASFINGNLRKTLIAYDDVLASAGKEKHFIFDAIKNLYIEAQSLDEELETKGSDLAGSALTIDAETFEVAPVKGAITDVRIANVFDNNIITNSLSLFFSLEHDIKLVEDLKVENLKKHLDSIDLTDEYLMSITRKVNSKTTNNSLARPLTRCRSLTTLLIKRLKAIIDYITKCTREFNKYS